MGEVTLPTLTDIGMAWCAPLFFATLLLGAKGLAAIDQRSRYLRQYA